MALVTSVIGIPIDCTGHDAGCGRAAGVPRCRVDCGVNIPDNGDLPVRLSDPSRDAVTALSVLNSCLVSETIRTGMRDLLHAGEKPLVLGGCCSLLIGIAAALRDIHGRAGLAFIDAISITTMAGHHQRRKRRYGVGYPYRLWSRAIDGAGR